MFNKRSFGLLMVLLFVTDEAAAASARITPGPPNFEATKSVRNVKLPAPKRVRRHESKRFITVVVTYRKSAQRSWWGEALTATFAPEQLEYTRRLVPKLGIRPEDATKYIQFKRDLIAEVSKRVGEEEYGIWRSPDRYTFCRADLNSNNIQYQRGAM
jgi:hypothetical protein